MIHTNLGAISHIVSGDIPRTASHGCAINSQPSISTTSSIALERFYHFSFMKRFCA